MIPDTSSQATLPLVEFARAKVNLTLRISGKRADGYHALESLVAFADEADRLTLDGTAPAGLTIVGPMAAGLAAAPDNLVMRAVEQASARFPGLRTGHITLEKHLPVAAGIGGGSADAGATLRLLRRANPGVGTDDQWLALAASLGADVPVCLADQAAVMSGIGETVVALGYALDLPALLVNAMVPVPANKTAAVFRALAAPPVSQVERPPSARLDIATGSNDLEAPALRVMPVIADVLSALRVLPGMRFARLSGAGPTCFAIFDTAEAAQHAKDILINLHPHWWVRATRLT